MKNNDDRYELTTTYMPDPITIRKAAPHEAGVLSELALRSKGLWGYSEKFLESCRAELSIDPEQLRSADYACFVALRGGSIAGYYMLELLPHSIPELDALFVEPNQIGHGIGRALLRNAIDYLRQKGARKLIIQGDPNAMGFYAAVGAHQIGTRESESIPGRELPLFEMDLRRIDSPSESWVRCLPVCSMGQLYTGPALALAPRAAGYFSP